MRLSALALFGCLVTSTWAQPIVVPSAALTAPSPARSDAPNAWTFDAIEARSQLVYDVNDIAAGAALLRSMEFRRPATGGRNYDYGATVSVLVSTSALAPAAMTTTFASNHGAQPVTVFSGKVVLAASAAPPPWPAPWEAPILFTTPYVFIKLSGQSLVVELSVSRVSGTAAWSAEQWSRENGYFTSVLPQQTSCRFSNGAWIGNPQLSYYLPLSVGGTWTVTYSGTATAQLPLSTPGFIALGAQGPGGFWGGLPLPLSLAAFGAPGCSVAVSIDQMLTINTGIGGIAAGPTVNIPNVPSLAGASFYDQGVFMQAQANALGFVLGPVTRSTLGSNRGGPGCLVYAKGRLASTQPTGTLEPEHVTTLRFQ